MTVTQDTRLPLDALGAIYWPSLLQLVYKIYNYLGIRSTYTTCKPNRNLTIPILEHWSFLSHNHTRDYLHR